MTPRTLRRKLQKKLKRKKFGTCGACGQQTRLLMCGQGMDRCLRKVCGDRYRCYFGTYLFYGRRRDGTGGGRVDAYGLM